MADGLCWRLPGALPPCAPCAAADGVSCGCRHGRGSCGLAVVPAAVPGPFSLHVVTSLWSLQGAVGAFPGGVGGNWHFPGVVQDHRGSCRC